MKSRGNIRKGYKGCVTIHGGWGTPTYASWKNMIWRCRDNFNGRTSYFENGITICERWMTFENFLADMGVRPAGTSIDRINNPKGYEPGNCRWATMAEQERNRKSTRWIEFNGEVRCVTDWAEVLGVSRSTINGRIRRGWPLDAALSRARKGE